MPRKSYPKPARILDKDYRDWIKSLPCLLCLFPYSDPHHVNPKGHGGKGTKTDDSRAIPLCNHHHREFHQIGRETFAKKYRIDYEKIIKTLNKLYKEKEVKKC